ncbi:flagellar motor protein MotB [Clostridium chromiireducens]|uniref:Motility protein B n=2 Tax=Clostridium chromiireducens TaxID=225345 RepID=A0A1V4J298_9CLOT|nr:flagellar motor protein MotB [Clostridium chromiireducens]OPJ65827.1 motility protein B [Clostridium chromiireducens]
MSRKKQHHEEHVDEAWLLPYSDMLTLLLALFIVMFAMGQTDKAKMQAMAKEFNIIFAGGSGMMEKDGNSMIPMEDAGESDSISTNDSQIEEDKMTEIKKKLEQEIKQEGYADKIKVDLNGEGLDIAIQDVVLFNSGEADVLKEVSPVLLKISKMLNGLDNQIRVAGYTDNVPISNGKFRSNWDLSAMRAINVMNFMVSSGGIKQDNVSIQAYGEYKPKTSNSTEEGKAQNRRVEIYVVRNFPVDKSNQ